MSAFNTRCAWLPCSKPLGVQVWRASKLSSQQFCSQECYKKHMDMEKRNGEAQEYRRLLARHPSTA